MPSARTRILLLLLLLLTCVIAGTRTSPISGESFQNTPNVPWATPTERALHNTGPVVQAADSRNYECTALTYRARYDLTKTMRSGCFVPTSFGLFDPSSSMVIFNGTDEGEQLRIGGQPAVISPLPFSATIASFGGSPYQGSYMYLHTDLLSKLEIGGSPTYGLYREVNKPPDFTVLGPTGSPLPVNRSAFAYSGRGQWMVTESPTNALVRVNLATFTVLPFDYSFYTRLNPFLNHGASMAITEGGRYAAAASNEFHTFKVYDLKTCTPKDTDDLLEPQRCQMHDYWSYVRDQVSGELRRISRVNFVNDGLISFQATMTSGAIESYLLSPTGNISSLIPYLGLGDSYASGQGAFNYLLGTDTSINRCHLSRRSYPLLLNADQYGGMGHSVACSGARIHDIGNSSSRYPGQSSDHRTAQQREADGSEVNILHEYSPGFLAQQRFVSAYLPNTITVQIGGNDIGFGQMLLRCLSPIAKVRPPRLNPNSCYQTYEDRLEVAQTIDRTYGRWVQLYRQLQVQSPLSNIFAIGYPNIFSDEAKCGLNVHLTRAEILFAKDVTNYLNSVIRRASEAAGVTFVDISQSLDGHELCTGSAATPAVNGLTAGDDEFGILGQESFHPNAYGHELIEQAILQSTNNLANNKPMPLPEAASPTIENSDPLLQAPKSGRAIAVTVPDDAIVSSRAQSGKPLAIQVTGEAAGTTPDTSYSVHLGNQAIGSIVSNHQGDVDGSLSVPIDAATGPQTVTIEGPNQSDGTVRVVDVVYVEENSANADGDGEANDQDSCPLIINSGVDADFDDIDDACDPVVEFVMSTDSSSGLSNAAPKPTVLVALDKPSNTYALRLVPYSSSSQKSFSISAAASTSKMSGRDVIHTSQPIPTSPSRQLPLFQWQIWAGIWVLLLTINYGSGGYIKSKLQKQ